MFIQFFFSQIGYKYNILLNPILNLIKFGKLHKNYILQSKNNLKNND